MFVVSLIIDGTLVKSAIRNTPNDAIATAHEWTKEFDVKKHITGTVIIDQHIQAEDLNRRFTEIKLGQQDQKVQLTLMEKVSQYEVTHKIAPVAKQVFLTFLEIALLKANEFLREEQRKGKKRPTNLF